MSEMDLTRLVLASRRRSLQTIALACIIGRFDFKKTRSSVVDACGKEWEDGLECKAKKTKG